MKRNFLVIRSNMKWYTDITEFNLRGKKIYLLSMVVGEILSPTALKLIRALNELEQAIKDYIHFW